MIKSNGIKENIGEEMNKTKRKIFETSMRLFAEKGYDATSIEEITATVGVAKGTEGVKLLKNSIAIKTDKLTNCLDKIRAIVLIELKVLVKYENFMTIILSEIWGTTERSKMCQKYVFDYIQMIEEIVKEGMEKQEIIKGDPNVIASGIFGFVCSSLIYRNRTDHHLDVQKLYHEIERSFIRKLKKEKGEEEK